MQYGKTEKMKKNKNRCLTTLYTPTFRPGAAEEYFPAIGGA
jgi:hypothetical protein